MQVIAIAAVARNGVIGQAGTIPWRLPEDFRRFRRLTTGHVVVMGRATFDSIGRPLPGRTSVVVTRASGWAPRDAPEPTSRGRWRFDDATLVVRAGSVPEALAVARELDPDGICWVAGGGAVYREAMPMVTALEITEVPSEPEGDTFFPVIDPARWHLVRRERFPGFTTARYEPVPRPGEVPLDGDAGMPAPTGP